MDNALHLSASPHIHSGRSTSAIMRDVLISLLPATVAGAVIFGWRSLLVIAVCVASCVLLEALFNLITKKPQTVGDLSAAVTGLLLALNLPANIPLWQCVVGSIFAIILVKCLFGGIGCNLVNPAITARVFMLVSFGSMANQAMPTIVDTVSGATPLASAVSNSDLLSLCFGENGTVELFKAFAAGENGLTSVISLLFGTTGGAIGETCAVALLIGFAYLLIRRIITPHVPFFYVGTVFAISFAVELIELAKAATVEFADVSAFNMALGVVLIALIKAVSLTLSGGLLIGAIFMATDYVTSPATKWGKVIFGIGAGVLTFAIRKYGVYPEGVSFAILFMNILTPYIEKLTARRVFGGKQA